MTVCTEKGAPVRKHCSKEEDIITDDSNIRSIVEKEIERLGRNANLNHIDVSAVTDMSALFHKLDFNGDIYLWDVRNVIDMLGMFANSTFDGDISHWKVDKVNIMTIVLTIRHWRISQTSNRSSIHNAKTLLGLQNTFVYHGCQTRRQISLLPI